ncbi:MAG: YggS family pyridoxal phosphate-dependent enzyme [Acidobacteriota bacterium]
MSDAAAIADRFTTVRRRLDEACARAGRRRDEVVLVAVSKRQPVDRCRAAVAAGQRIFGESRVQEAEEKRGDLPTDLEWHLIGPLQSNKAKRAARLFDVVHSLDRPKIVRLLDREAREQGRTIDAFLQINVGGEASKSGFHDTRFDDQVRPLIEHGRAESGSPGVRFIGLMAIPPFEADAEEARRWFRRLRELRDRVASWPEWSGFRGDLSMGMSHDFEIAIEEGATHVRVGTDCFGVRPS